MIKPALQRPLGGFEAPSKKVPGTQDVFNVRSPRLPLFSHCRHGQGLPLTPQCIPGPLGVPRCQELPELLQRFIVPVDPARGAGGQREGLS